MESFFTDLNYLDLMSVTGTDNKKLLQGQLTCNVEALPNNRSCLGASCNNKGRVLSSFRLANLNEVLYLQMKPGLLSLLKQSLEKYSVFYQVEIDDSTELYHRIGLTGNDAENFLANIFQELPANINDILSHKGKHIIKVSHSPARYELWLDNESREVVIPTLKENIQQKPLESWELFDLQLGIYQLEALDSGLYTPQSLNLDLREFIDFSKGCYTGQEIVARMHYLGNAKKRLFHLTIFSEKAVTNGLQVTLENGKKLGRIIKVVHEKKNTYQALAILAPVIDEAITVQGLIEAKVSLKSFN